MAPRNTERGLKEETGRWTDKITRELVSARPLGAKGADFLRNIRAYVSDSGHFMGKGDLIRSFEAIIWAWAWLEIGRQLGLIESIKKKATDKVGKKNKNRI